MSNSAYIRDITSLEELRIAIARFCEESNNQLQAIDSKIQTRISNLKSLEHHFQRKVESAQEELRSAYQSLEYCEMDTDEDDDGNTTYPDCRREREEVYECKKQLDSAVHKYNTFKREIQNLEMAIAEYAPPKIKYKTILQWKKEAATSSLKQLISGAEDYLSVTSPMNHSAENGLGLTEATAKIDPTMILAATVGIAEIIFTSLFSFFGLGGSLFNISNKEKNGIVTTTYSENGKEHTCSELKIENKGSSKYGKIAGINIPQGLQNEKIGKYLIQNMEATCRANDCKEIYGWANEANIPFFKNLGYETRNEVKGIGAEVFKPLEGIFLNSQKNAKIAFENLDNTAFTKANNLGKQEVNPLHIISPNEVNDERFWQQHGENQHRYFDLIEKYDYCRKELNSGKALEQIRKEDSWVANAYDVFHGSEPIRLLKSGDHYCIDSNGRHRVAAAQTYYMRTGKIITLTADVFEKN